MMRYLHGTFDYGIKYASNGEIRLHGFTDLEGVGSVEDRKRTSGCCFSLGLGMISWFSKKKSSISLSMTEAEYIATCLACKEVVWLHKTLTRLFDAEINVIDILCDNHRCIKMTEKPVFHDKSKHIEVRYHYIWYMV